MSELQVFASKSELVEHALKLTINALKEGISQNGSASIACSGGSTPGPMYSELSKTDMDWGRVNIVLADERWVAADHDRANEKLVRNTLLTNKAAPAHFLPMITDDASPWDAADKINSDYQVIKDGLDVLVLGMGPDGHSLSWFPEAKGLADVTSATSDRLVGAVTANRSDVTGDNLDRMTLAYRAVRDASLVLLMITGKEKRDVLEGGDASLPIRHVERAAGERLKILWCE